MPHYPMELFQLLRLKTIRGLFTAMPAAMVFNVSIDLTDDELRRENLAVNKTKSRFDLVDCIFLYLLRSFKPHAWSIESSVDNALTRI